MLSLPTLFDKDDSYCSNNSDTSKRYEHDSPNRERMAFTGLDNVSCVSSKTYLLRIVVKDYIVVVEEVLSDIDDITRILTSELLVCINYDLD